MVDRSIIAGVLGNTEASNVLDEFINCIGIRWAIVDSNHRPRSYQDRALTN
jgi:hypothetical protein